MADNRLDLKHIPTGDTFRLAKFYYSSGWYVNATTDAEKVAFVDRLNDWLDGHKCDDMENHGATYILEYEAGEPGEAKADA